MAEELVNKVALSGIVTIDLEEIYPSGERVLLDIESLLFQGLILREKDFRAFVKQEDWSKYQDKYVAIVCSADAIVPVWAYMLLATRLEPFAKRIVFGSLDYLDSILLHDGIQKICIEDYQDARVVVKGCGNVEIPNSAYVEITALLRPVAKSIMYGEPCSTVPLYKAPKP